MFAPGRLRGKIGKFVMAGERKMHLGDASSDLRHVTQVGDLLLAFARVFACSQHPLFIDKAIEISRCHGPCVALILDEGMNDRDRTFVVATKVRSRSFMPSSRI